MGKPDYSQITCKSCNQNGGISKSKIRRMSGPTVVIGYIFLVPSVLGMLLGVMMIFATGGATSEVAESQAAEYSDAIHQIQGLSPERANAIVAGESGDTELLATLDLTSAQQAAVSEARLMKSAGDVGAGAGAALGIGFAIFLIVSSFVGGLVGWILTMKKTVLLCGNCKGVHADAV